MIGVDVTSAVVVGMVWPLVDDSSRSREPKPGSVGRPNVLDPIRCRSSDQTYSRSIVGPWLQYRPKSENRGERLAERHGSRPADPPCSKAPQRESIDVGLSERIIAAVRRPTICPSQGALVARWIGWSETVPYSRHAHSIRDARSLSLARIPSGNEPRLRRAPI